MRKRMLKNIAFIGICLSCALVYFQVFDNKKKEDKPKDAGVSNYQTIVLKDKYNTLVPIEVNMGIEGEKDIINRNILQLMASNDYVHLGLYPLLSSELQVQAMHIDKKTLTFDFNDSLYASNNEDALDILEGLAYTFCRDGIERINIKIDGKEVNYLPNSTVPVSCLTSTLGINNFDSDSLQIHRTVPVMVYNKKMIHNHAYYVPVTTRIEVDSSDINTQVSMILNKIDYDKPIHSTQVQMEGGKMKVSLSSNILLDNETIDQTLYQQLIKSLKSITGITDVSLYVDQQEITPVKDVNVVINNRIRL